MKALHEINTRLTESEHVSKIRAEQLRRAIEVGLSEIERGEVAPLDITEVKRKARNRREFEHQA